MSSFGNRTKKGSALLTALIFAFVLMVIVSSLAYNLRLSKLAITSLIDENTNVNIDEGYLKALFANGGVNSDITDTAGDFSFETTINSITPGFYPKNTNVALY